METTKTTETEQENTEIINELVAEFLPLYDELTTSDLQSAVAAAARNAIGNFKGESTERETQIADAALAAIEQQRKAGIDERGYDGAWDRQEKD